MHCKLFYSLIYFKHHDVLFLIRTFSFLNLCVWMQQPGNWELCVVSCTCSGTAYIRNYWIGLGSIADTTRNSAIVCGNRIADVCKNTVDCHSKWLGKSIMASISYPYFYFFSICILARAKLRNVTINNVWRVYAQWRFHLQLSHSETLFYTYTCHS